MKKICLLIITFVIIISSCDSNIEIKSTSNSETIQTLKVLNESLPSNKYQTRGWWDRFIRIAKSDCFGAFLGGVSGTSVGSAFGQPAIGATIGAICVGTLYSYKAASIDGYCTFAINQRKDQIIRELFIEKKYIENTRSNSPNTKSMNFYKLCSSQSLSNTNAIKYCSAQIEKKVNIDKDVISKINLEEDVLNVGKRHNIILAILSDEIVFNEEDISNDLSTDEFSILSSALFEEIINQNIACDFSNNLENDEAIPSQVIKLFNDIFETYPNNIDDVVYLINSYVRIIDESKELSLEEKLHIKYGLSTAIYSYNYWENTINE